MRRSSLKIAVAVACAIGVASIGLEAAAAPIGIGGAGGPSFQVDPIYFQGYDTFGLADAGKPDYFASSPIVFLSVGAGAGMDLSLTQALQEPVYQHPQAPSISQNPLTNGGVPTSPTEALPFVADSMWTLTNNTLLTLDDVLLLFTKTSGETGYPAVDVALDNYLYDVLEYESTTAGTLAFGALPLGDLLPLQQVTVRVRYIVADPLFFQGSQYVMPPLGLSAITKASYVPEPTTAVLLAAGLAILGRRVRRTH